MISDIEQRRLCTGCIQDDFLRSEVERQGEQSICNYCDKKALTASVSELAAKVDDAFESHYERTASEPSSQEREMMEEGDWLWAPKGESVTDIISMEAKIDYEPSEDIRKVLEERHSDWETGEEGAFDEETCYVARDPDDNKYRKNWRDFEESLKTEARFFSEVAKSVLDSVFQELSGPNQPCNQLFIVEAGPATGIPVLCRARTFQSESALREALKRPDLHVGPPPAANAQAGRMNPHGISVFYGATEAEVAIGEVRPPVGSEVLLARFELTRPVRLLDVTALASVPVNGSVFDSDYINRLEKAKFLGTLSGLITRPVMPDNEHSEYLITQVIAEYLAGRSDLELDGLLYRSAQGEDTGDNVMLFHRASRVELSDVSDDTQIQVDVGDWTEDGWETNYWVWEEVPPAKTEKTEGDGGKSEASEIGTDKRDYSLCLNVEKLEVHHVNAVRFHTEEHRVKRHRSMKGEEPDF